MESKTTIEILWKTQQESYRSWLCVSAGVSFSTITSYVSDIQGWLKFLSTESVFLEGEEGLQKNLLEYLAHRGDHGSKGTTLVRIVSSVRSFFTYLIRMEILPDTILLGLEGFKKSTNLPRVLSWPQVQKLLKNVKTPLESTIVKILVFLGLRVSELVQLRRNNWNFDKKTLLVVGKGNKERILPVPEILWEDFNKIESTSEWMFPGRRKGDHFTRMSVWNLVQKLAKRCDIGEHLHPHIFRHTLATRLLEKGMDIFYIKELLGHADISSTEIYMHVRPNRLQDLLRNHHPLYH